MGKNILTKELLLRSVEEWNKAREANPDLKPDLRGADLREADLRGADLDEADLREADLCEADCRDSDFCEADLSGAQLIMANLRSVNFLSANLSEANLTGAELTGAHLGKANLSRSDLSYTLMSGTMLSDANLTGAALFGAIFRMAFLNKANLSEAIVSSTTFGHVNLSSTIGLETIRHSGPSTIGIDTFYLSNGNIPEVFLRGCGVPDNFIEYVRSLTAKPIEYYSCFISYSHKNEEFAQRLHTDLQANNVRCWFAPHDLPIGAKTRPAIDDAIRIHDKLLLILSENSVQSNWVEHEVEHALDLETERGKLVLFPVRLDDAVMDSKTGWASNVKRQRNIGDFTRWKDHDAYQQAFSRLLRDLKQSDKPKK
jgi:uncharacterized protein YjbI with pentapeptide repeats